MITYLALRGAAALSECNDASCPVTVFETQAPKLMLAGTLVGAAVGRTSARYRWEPVWLAGASEPPR